MIGRNKSRNLFNQQQSLLAKANEDRTTSRKDFHAKTNGDRTTSRKNFHAKTNEDQTTSRNALLMVLCRNPCRNEGGIKLKCEIFSLFL